jgi:hypothetical protein
MIKMLTVGALGNDIAAAAPLPLAAASSASSEISDEITLVESFPVVVHALPPLISASCQQPSA